MAESAPDGWYYSTVLLHHALLPAIHIPAFLPTYQGALLDLGTLKILNINGLSESTYTFYFAIDINMDGNLDLDQIYYDSVGVNVTPYLN